MINLSYCAERQINLYGYKREELFVVNPDQQDYFLGHIIEEVGEARKCFPRKSWKSDEPDFTKDLNVRKEFLKELVDIHLFIENYFLFSIDKPIWLTTEFEDYYSNTVESIVDFPQLVREFNALIEVFFWAKPELYFYAVVRQFAIILNVAGVTKNEFLMAYKEKVKFNQVRPDHNV
jgi:hypothetical protein